MSVVVDNGRFLCPYQFGSEWFLGGTVWPSWRILCQQNPPHADPVPPKVYWWVGVHDDLSRIILCSLDIVVGALGSIEAGCFANQASKSCGDPARTPRGGRKPEPFLGLSSAPRQCPRTVKQMWTG